MAHGRPDHAVHLYRAALDLEPNNLRFRMMLADGLVRCTQVSAAAHEYLEVARHYAERYPGLVDHFVIDSSDAKLVPGIEDLGMAVAVAPTVMHSLEDKVRLARAVLELLETD